MNEFTKTKEEVISELRSDAGRGLDSAEAGKRLEKYGKNELKKEKKRSVLARFLSSLADPMTIILIVAAVVSGVISVISNESLAESVIILAVVVINSVLSVVQEGKAENAIEALRKIASPTAKVIRDGENKTINAADVTIGDILVLEAGDNVPADARLIEAHSLKAEESALTGESVPVNKSTDAIESGGNTPLGDRRNMVYSGSSISYGRAKAVVCAVGMETEMGKIAGVIADAGKEETPLQRRLTKLSKQLTVLVIAISIVIFAVNLIRYLPNVNINTLLDTFMVAVSLAVAAIPEGLAAVVTVVLSMGVTRMSKRRAIVRRLTAVETLGCTGVICSDKTGTLTQNKMTVVERSAGDIPLLIRAMQLCSDAEVNESGEVVGEPTEAALVADGLANGQDKREEKLEYPRVGEAPFDSERKMMSTLHRTEDGIIQFTKGAPDEILKKCRYIYSGGEIRPITEDDIAGIKKTNHGMADRALRVLAAAMKRYEKMPGDISADAIECDLCFIGSSGMIDPIRPEVKDAVADCRSAGITPVMITGDHKDTAVAIARQLSIIEDENQAMTGTELDELSDEQLERDIDKHFVYARVRPEHKVRIVNAWKKRGQVTAMTGDGVNDAPSIKSADIGVGMGITGTDVTKNVADIVLADDNFATIVSAVGEGRRIYDNLKKAVQFLLSSNIAEVIAVFVATLCSFTILRPAHLLWVNLITDSMPALALGMEKPEADVMRRKPRDPHSGFFGDGAVVSMIIASVAIAALTLGSYFIGAGVNCEGYASTMAFITLSFAEIFHSFNMRSIKGSIIGQKNINWWLFGSFVASILLSTAVVFIPPVAAVFGFASVSVVDFLKAVALGACVIPVVEVRKLVHRLFERK